jgi:hypothetical protein
MTFDLEVKSMLLTEIIDVILCESGEFVSGDLECIGISKELLYKGIVKREIETYQRYRPATFHFNRLAIPSGNAEAVIFFSKEDSSGTHDGSGDAGNVFDQRVGIFNRDPGGVPRWVSSVIPVNVLTTAGILYLIQETRFTNVGEQSILHEPRTFLINYERDSEHGVLYVTETGKMDIIAHYDYPRVEMYDIDGKLVDVDIKFIEEGKDEVFLDMVLGKFMEKVGRSRRKFTLNNSPIQFDGQELASEGDQIYQQAKERLYDGANWYDAIGI